MNPCNTIFTLSRLVSNGLSRFSGLAGLQKWTFFHRFGKPHSSHFNLNDLGVNPGLLRRHGHILSQTGSHLSHQTYLRPKEKGQHSLTLHTWVPTFPQIQGYISAAYPWIPIQRITTVNLSCCLLHVLVPESSYKQCLGDFCVIRFQGHFTRCCHILTSCLQHFYHKVCAKLQST